MTSHTLYHVGYDTLKIWWPKLTDQDIGRTGMKTYRLIDILQEKYSWNRDYAREEVDMRLRQFSEQKERVAHVAKEANDTELQEVIAEMERKILKIRVAYFTDLLGAIKEVHCVLAKSGDVPWRKNIHERIAKIIEGAV